MVGLTEAAVGYVTTVEGSGENGLEDDVNSKKTKSSMVSEIQILDKSTQLLYSLDGSGLRISYLQVSVSFFILSLLLNQISFHVVFWTKAGPHTAPNLVSRVFYLAKREREDERPWEPG